MRNCILNVNVDDLYSTGTVAAKKSHAKPDTHCINMKENELTKAKKSDQPLNAVLKNQSRKIARFFISSVPFYPGAWKKSISPLWQFENDEAILTSRGNAFVRGHHAGHIGRGGSSIPRNLMQSRLFSDFLCCSLLNSINFLKEFFSENF